MSEVGEAPLYESREILDMVGRAGISLASLDPDRLFLFLVSSVVSGFSLGVLWRREGQRFRWVCASISDADFRRESERITSSFKSAVHSAFMRTQETLETTQPIDSPCCGRLRVPLSCETQFGGEIKAQYLLLLELENRGYLLELYCQSEISGESCVAIASFASELEPVLLKRFEEITAALRHGSAADVRHIDSERRLFRYVVRDMRSWFGEDIRHVNIFSFDPRDRMLYHLETTHLELNKDLLSTYEPVAEIGDVDIKAYINQNFLRSTRDGHDKDALIKALEMLGSKERTRRFGYKNEELLRTLLTYLPQEPGTGVAGETAITRIPQVNEDPADPRWQTQVYSGKFFAAMLSVEKLFGIASSGNRMAAVPLMESGRLWGVLFVVQRKSYTRRRLLELWERAQQLSSVLSLFSTFQFQHALTKSARFFPNRSTAELAMESIHLALNPILGVHWQLHGAGSDRVEVWQQEGSPGRFSRAYHEEGKKGAFKAEDIRRAIHERIMSGKIDVQECRGMEAGPRTGLPADIKVPAGDQIRSVIMIPAPPKDLLVIYTDEGVDSIRRNLVQLEDRFSVLWDIEGIRSSRMEHVGVVAESQAMQKVLKQAEKYGESERANVILLRGENGTGKEVLAERIRKASPRGGIYVPVNCASISVDLIESELFGAEPHAFTGAGSKRKQGYFETADRGVIFLDEIGELPPTAQAKFLRVVETGEIMPVGGAGKLRKVDVKIVAASNRNFEEMISKGQFREDLFYRINSFPIEIPPLRDRRADIPGLARHFAADESRISATAMAAILNHPWPGNARELRNLIWKAVVDCEPSGLIGEELLPHTIRAASGPCSTYSARRISEYLGQSSEEQDPCKGWALLSKDVYGLAENPLEDWTLVAAKAFSRLATLGVKPSSFCSIGCGLGLDAVAAFHAWQCGEMVLTDVNEAVTVIAKENVYLNCGSRGVKVEVLVSNMFSDMGDRRFDIIYENLPNLPWMKEEGLAGIDLATFVDNDGSGTNPHGEWLLDSHARFLAGAKRHLADSGIVLCSIGARVPWEIIEELFISSGYRPQLIYATWKEQQENEIVVPEYVSAEERGLGPFSFLDLSAIDQISGRPEIQDNPEAIRDRLRCNGVSAREALSLQRAGKKVGHGVYVIAGYPSDKNIPN